MEKIELSGMVPIAQARKKTALPVNLSTIARWCVLKNVPAVKIGARWFVRPNELVAAALEIARKKEHDKPIRTYVYSKKKVEKTTAELVEMIVHHLRINHGKKFGFHWLGKNVCNLKPFTERSEALFVAVKNDDRIKSDFTGVNGSAVFFAA